MKTFGSLAESITGRPASPLLSNGDRPCECGEWYPSHACWTCHDAGRIATSRGRAGESWADFRARVGERAGVSVACPACVRTATVDPVAELDRMHVPVRFREVTIDSWRDKDGKLWEPNTLIPVDLPTLRLPETELLLAEVTYMRDDYGTHARMTLMPPEAFTVQPYAFYQNLAGFNT